MLFRSPPPDEKIINPKTGRPIAVGGPIYNKLTTKERADGLRLWKQKVVGRIVQPKKTIKKHKQDKQE